MADHSNYPKSISKHHTPESELTYGTIGSVVIDASDRVLWAWSGNPCGGVARGPSVAARVEIGTGGVAISR